MIRVGLISDTHSWLDKQIFEYFADVDEIWHAGDIGSEEVLDALQKFKPVRAVYGNIDGGELRLRAPLNLRFEMMGLDIWMTHIGGYPGRYSGRVKQVLDVKAPDVFICGHSHILKVMRDKKYKNMLCLNPGAAGFHGFHKVRTALRFNILNNKISDLEVIELGLRGKTEI